MSQECLICKSKLEYLEFGIEMQCALCRKKEMSKTRCVGGHYICNDCHMGGMDKIFDLCLKETSKNPVEILGKMMDMDFCQMHGPEHHILVGASLLTAYKNAGGKVDLPSALPELSARAKQVPGGACGFWGTCGAGISTGMFVSVVTKSTPLTKEPWSLSNKMTSLALDAIGKNGGPRCCKRDSFLAITEAVKFASERLGVHMKTEKIVCTYSHRNNQCIKENCPFYSENRNESEENG